MELRASILREYPNTRKFESEIDFLIDQYNLDKEYVNKLMKTACASEALMSEAMGGVSTLEVGSDEYERVMARMNEAQQKLAPPEKTECKTPLSPETSCPMASSSTSDGPSSA
jgi:hypothetical protein